MTRYPGGSFTILVSAPRTARYHIVVEAAGLRLDGFPRFAASECDQSGARLACRAGPFKAIPRGFSPWKVTVVKISRPAARVRVRLRFTGSSA